MSEEIQPSLHARGGPANYLQGSGILPLIADYTEGRQAAAITGTTSFQAFKLAGGTLGDSQVEHYDGTVSLHDIERLAARTNGIKRLVAIGGGRVCDTAKAVASRIDAELITVPTIAATCAAYSSHTVLYDERHVKIGSEQHDRGPLATITDTELLVNAPVRYLISGIGDSLAKWYEANAIMHNYAVISPTERFGLQAADNVRQLLVDKGELAVKANREHSGSSAFDDVIEAIFPLSGSVGGFSDRKGRASGAHATANALTSLPGSENSLHGEKVAYGILVLLTVLGQRQEVAELRRWYETIHLPRTLEDLGIKVTERNIQSIGAFAASSREIFRLAVPDITADRISDAVRAVELLS